MTEHEIKQGIGGHLASSRLPKNTPGQQNDFQEILVEETNIF